MRTKTKKRLLEVLESDLKRVKDKLVAKHQEPMQKVATEMGEIANKLRTMKYGPGWDKLNLRYKKLDVEFQEFLKASEKYSNSIQKNMEEQFALEEDIQELKMILSYARPDTSAK